MQQSAYPTWHFTPRRIDPLETPSPRFAELVGLCKFGTMLFVLDEADEPCAVCSGLGWIWEEDIADSCKWCRGTGKEGYFTANDK